MGTKISLQKVASTLNEKTSRLPTTKYTPYVWADIQVTVRLSISRNEGEDIGEFTEGYKVEIEVPSPTEEDDAILLCDLEKNISSHVLDGIQTATPYITINDITEAFRIDTTAPLWEVDERA